jgi:hypothetical protein
VINPVLDRILQDTGLMKLGDVLSDKIKAISGLQKLQETMDMALNANLSDKSLLMKSIKSLEDITSDAGSGLLGKVETVVLSPFNYITITIC